jgi:hypothetical protein
LSGFSENKNESMLHSGIMSLSNSDCICISSGDRVIDGDSLMG